MGHSYMHGVVRCQEKHIEDASEILLDNQLVEKDGYGLEQVRREMQEILEGKEKEMVQRLEEVRKEVRREFTDMMKHIQLDREKLFSEYAAEKRRADELWAVTEMLKAKVDLLGDALQREGEPAPHQKQIEELPGDTARPSRYAHHFFHLA